MKSIFPPKLKLGDHLRVVAPSRSLALLSKETITIANKRLEKLGFKVSFGAHVLEADRFFSTTIEHRVADLHEAFADPSVDGILTVIGGFNSNQLLSHLDWDLIKKNPKVFCGFSDITALNNSLYAKTGLVTYSGPHYSSFGQQLHFEYTQENFKKTLMTDQSFSIASSKDWSDDTWWMNQKARKLLPNPGLTIIHEGEAEGTLIGGNLCTLNLLQGTEYMPDLQDTIVCVEDDGTSDIVTFDRNLQSLLHQPGFDGVKGILIGRFQKATKMDDATLKNIIATKSELRHLPIISGLDFGHTDPKITLPIGGYARMIAKADSATVEILKH